MTKMFGFIARHTFRECMTQIDAWQRIRARLEDLLQYVERDQRHWRRTCSTCDLQNALLEDGRGTTAVGREWGVRNDCFVHQKDRLHRPLHDRDENGKDRDVGHRTRRMVETNVAAGIPVANPGGEVIVMVYRAESRRSQCEKRHHDGHEPTSDRTRCEPT